MEKQTVSNKKWWHNLIGSPRSNPSSAVLEKDFSHIVNRECGVEHRMKGTGMEWKVNCLQDRDTSQLSCQLDGARLGSFGVMREGWRRCSSSSSSSSRQYEIDLKASSVRIRFDNLPIGRVWIAGDEVELTDGTEILIEKCHQPLQLFLPDRLTVSRDI